MIAQVYVNTKNLNIDKPFDYLVPKDIEDKICVGCRVKVPFGGGNLPKEAFVTLLKEESDFSSLKPVKSIMEDFPALTKSAVSLCFYMRERYFCTFWDAASIMLPPGTDAKFEEWISLSHKYYEHTDDVKGFRQQQLIRLLEESDGSCEMMQIKISLGKNARTIVNSLHEKGIVEKSFLDKRRANEKTMRVVYYSAYEDISYYINKLEKSAPRQAAVLSALSSLGEASVADLVSASSSS